MAGRWISAHVRSLTLAGVMAIALLAGGIGQSILPDAFGHAPSAHADVELCIGC